MDGMFVFLQIFEKKIPAQNGTSPPCFSSILFTVGLVWVNLRVGPLTVSSNWPRASSKKNGLIVSLGEFVGLSQN